MIAAIGLHDYKSEYKYSVYPDDGEIVEMPYNPPWPQDTVTAADRIGVAKIEESI